MAVLKCEMCGSKVHTEEGKFTAICEYCGTEMTVFESTSEFEIDSKGTLVAYNGKGGDIVIPDDIITIGENCFFENDKIYSVKIPNSVKKIKACAFRRCYELENIELPENLEEIGESALRGCTSLTEITLPPNVIKIPAQLLRACELLERVIIKGSVRRIEEYAFANCPKLAEINIPDTVKVIGAYAFCECKKLTEVNLSNSIRELGEGAFEGAVSLQKVRIPDLITEINERAFRNCSSLIDLDLNNVEEIGRKAFDGCSQLKNLDLKKVKIVRGWAFDNCSSITKIDSGVVENFEDYAICKCPGIKKVILNDKLKALGNSLFFESQQIKEVILPRFLKSCGGNVFRMSTCKRVFCYNNTPALEVVKTRFGHNLRILITKSDVMNDLGIDASADDKKQSALNEENERYEKEMAEIGNGLVEAIAPLKSEREVIGGELNTLKNDYNNKNYALKQTLNSLRKELSGLGIFSGKRKKELNGLIAQKEMEQQEITAVFNLRENELKQKENELINKINPLQKKLIDIDVMHQNNLSKIKAKYKNNNNFVGKTLRLGSLPVNSPDTSELIKWKVTGQKGDVLDLKARCTDYYAYYDVFDGDLYEYRLNANNWVKSTFSSDEAKSIVRQPSSFPKYISDPFEVTMSIDLKKLLENIAD